jgi:hypothetical protein
VAKRAAAPRAGTYAAKKAASRVVIISRPASPLATRRVFGIKSRRAAHIDKLVDEILEADGE